MRYLRTACFIFIAASVAALPVVVVAAQGPVSDRERFQADQTARNNQQALAAQDQELRREDLALRRSEQERSRWTNPLVLAIVAAAIAALGNAVVAGVNGRQQRSLERERANANRVLERYKSRAEIKLEADKAKAQIDLEDRKAESDRILEVVKTGGNTEAAAVNLQFLLDAGLVSTTSLAERLDAFLKARKPGEGPVLPAADGRFRIEASPDKTSEGEAISKSLRQFCDYLDHVGFARPEQEVSISFEDVDDAYYDPATCHVVLGPPLQKEPDGAYREYMHHVLMAMSNVKHLAGNAFRNIEAGLADYFACSFIGRPGLGAEAAKAWKMDRPFARSLTSQKDYSDLGQHGASFDNDAIWGTLFWNMRESMDHDTSDKLLLSTWRTMQWPKDRRRTTRAFLKALLENAGAEPSGEVLATVEACLRKGAFPLPK